MSDPAHPAYRPYVEEMLGKALDVAQPALGAVVDIALAVLRPDELELLLEVERKLRGLREALIDRAASPAEIEEAYAGERLRRRQVQALLSRPIPSAQAAERW